MGVNVFVTGATGFVGQAILQRLKHAGHSASILTRKPDMFRVKQIAARYGAVVHSGSVLDAGSLPDALADIHAIIHLVGIISEIGENTFENVHKRGTENVLALAKRSGVRRFIHMSALRTRPKALSRYHQTKWAAEEAVRQSALDYTIFRPSLIFGPRDQFVNVFARIILRSPVVPILGNPQTRFQPVSVDAVAQAFVASLTESKAIGQIYDLCGSETQTLPEIIDALLAFMKKKRLKLRVPQLLARLQASVMEYVFPRLLGKASPLNRDQLIMLYEDNVGNPQPANELFGLGSSSIQEYLRSYEDIFRRRGAADRKE